MREGIAAYFPEANGPTRRMAACMFTTSPDEHSILDRHSAMDDAFIAPGFSGHGYKFCSVIGRVMANFCLGRRGLGWGRGGGGELPLPSGLAVDRLIETLSRLDAVHRTPGAARSQVEILEVVRHSQLPSDELSR